MAFGIIYGHLGTDKTEKCMELIKSSLGKYSRIYYLVPEYLSFSAEKNITRLLGSVSSAGVEVTSFKKLYIETVNIAGEKGRTKLTACGRTMIISYLCSKLKKELTILGKTAAHAGFAQVMANVIKELKTCSVTPDMLKHVSKNAGAALSRKLSDIALVFDAYEKFLENGYSDAQDEMGILANIISENPGMFSDSLFIFDGFVSFSPEQMRVISALPKTSEIWFSFTIDNLDGSENEIYTQQKKYIEKLRKVLGKEQNTVKADDIKGADAFSERKEILNHYLDFSKEDCDFKPENLKIAEFTDQYREIEYVAEEIISLIKKDVRYRDITMIAKDADRYFPIISSVFKKYDIPVFIDSKMSAANHSAVSVVISALEVLRENFSYESVFSYLKTGFSNISDYECDLLENYVIATGIRGKSWTKNERWEYLPYVSKIFDDSEEFLDEINNIKEKVATPLINLKNRLDSARNVKDGCQALLDFILEIGLYEKIKGMTERFKTFDPQTAAYFGQVWNMLVKTLDETVETMGDIKESKEVFISMLVSGFAAQELSIIPTTIDAVSVATPQNMGEELNGYVFVVGANDGVYPSPLQAEGIFSDRDREYLSAEGIELSSDSLSTIMTENYTTLKVFSSAAKRMYITYPIGDIGGGARFPSIEVKKIKNIFPLMETESHITTGSYPESRITRPRPTFEKYIANQNSDEKLSPLWEQAGAWFEQNSEWKNKLYMMKRAKNFHPVSASVNPQNIERVYAGGLKLSVSSLEKYAKCPFAYFANYTLGLKTREMAEIKATDTGSLMHEAVEKLSKAIIKNGYSWKSASVEFLEKETARITDEIITELEKKFDYTSGKHIWMLVRVKEMLEKSVMYIAEHLRAGEFEPLGYEIEFDDNKEYEPLSFEICGKKVKLRGKVDRADIFYDENGEKYIRVIDYKSGSRDFDVSSMLYGLQLQLAVYLDRLCDETGAKPAGILYFRMFDPMIEAGQDLSDAEILEKLDEQHRMTGVVLADDKIISAMDKNISGASRIIPVKYNKDSGFSKNSSTLNAVQFKGMQKKIDSIIKKAAAEILGGNTKIYPAKFQGMTGCDYCDYKKVCFFDERCGGKYNVLDKITKEDAEEILQKAGEEND